MIYDCFCYFNEDELLDLRINYLKDVVDKFVIIEAAKTFSGFSKPQNFDINKFADIKDKIIYIFLENMPESDDPWVYESYQRNYIFDVLKLENCNNGDIVIISDLDEIPSKSAIAEYQQNPKGVKSLLQNFYNLYLNLFNENESPWDKAKIMTYGDFFDPINDSGFYQMCMPESANQGITATKIRMNYSFNRINNGGWHFSYIGDVDTIINKIKSFSHQEFNNEFFTDPKRIENCLKDQTDILARNQTYKKVEIDESFPDYLLANLDKYKKYIL